MSVSRHHSRNRSSQSRPRNSRNASVASVPYLPQVESLFIPGGAVSEEATQLLQDTLIDEEHGPINNDTDADGELKARANLPWWKRPSPLWCVSCSIHYVKQTYLRTRCRLLLALPFASVSTAATLAPRIEIYTILACSVHKPEYTMHLRLSKQLGLPYLEDASDLLVSNALRSGFVVSPLLPINVASEGNIAHIYLPDASNGTDDDDKWLDRCASDPVVQAAVAKLTAGE